MSAPSTVEGKEAYIWRQLRSDGWCIAESPFEAREIPRRFFLRFFLHESAWYEQMEHLVELKWK